MTRAAMNHGHSSQLNAHLKARASDVAAVYRIADSLEPRARQAFLDAVAQARGRIDLTALAVALSAGDASRVHRVLAAGDLTASLQPLVLTLRQVFYASGEQAATELGFLLTQTLQFDLTNPRAMAWASRFGSQLITQITESTRAGIQTLIADGLAGTRTVEETARAIRDLIGLTERQATAVLTYRDELMAAGQAGDLLDRRVLRYGEQLLNQRARIIARTETIRASAQGQLELWQQAAGDGLIRPATTSRRWIATEDDRICPICSDLDGVAVPFAGQFRSDDGQILDTPPAHPNCRCTTALDFA